MVSLKVKTLFFDSAKVLRAVDRATRQALSRAGAFIRRRARSSIRKRKGVSKPGKPPHSHVGTLRRLLYFAYEPADQSVVIGPLARGEGVVPALLEHGGRVTGRVVSAQSRRRTGQRVKRYRRRPFMGPALAAELPKLPERWRNSIRG